MEDLAGDLGVVFVELELLRKPSGLDSGLVLALHEAVAEVVGFRGSVSGGGRLDALYILEEEARLLAELLLCGTLYDFHQERATRPQILIAEFEDDAIQSDGADVVDVAIAHEIWHRIRTHDVRLLEIEHF